MMKNLAKYFDWIAFGLLAAASPLFIFPKTRFWFILLIIPILWISRKFLKGQFSESTPVDFPIFIFLVTIFVTCLKVTDWGYSLPKIAGVFFALAFFYALVNLLKTKQLILSAVYLFLAGQLAFAVIGLLGMPTFKEKHLHLLANLKDKIPQINFNLPGAELGFAPTVVGGILLFALPPFLVMIFTSSGLKRIMFGLGLLFCGGVLILTQARGAWMGLFLSTMLIGFAFIINLNSQRKRISLALIAITLILIVNGALFYIKSHENELKPGIKQAEGTMLFRFEMWNLAIPVIRDNPMWGIGLNNFRSHVPEVRFFLSHAHNQFLHIAAELGISAAIAFMAIIIIMGLMCFEVWKKCEDKTLKWICLALGWGQLGHLIFCMTDAIPPGSKVGILFWISLALITTIYLNQGAFLKNRPLDPQKTFIEKDERNN